MFLQVGIKANKRPACAGRFFLERVRYGRTLAGGVMARRLCQAHGIVDGKDRQWRLFFRPASGTNGLRNQRLSAILTNDPVAIPLNSPIAESRRVTCRHPPDSSMGPMVIGSSKPSPPVANCRFFLQRMIKTGFRHKSARWHADGTSHGMTAGFRDSSHRRGTVHAGLQTVGILSRMRKYEFSGSAKTPRTRRFCILASILHQAGQGVLQQL